jgi:hypothetical protein
MLVAAAVAVAVEGGFGTHLVAGLAAALAGTGVALTAGWCLVDR